MKIKEDTNFDIDFLLFLANVPVCQENRDIAFKSLKEWKYTACKTYQTCIYTFGMDTEDSDVLIRCNPSGKMAVYKKSNTFTLEG